MNFRIHKSSKKGFLYNLIYKNRVMNREELEKMFDENIKFLISEQRYNIKTEIGERLYDLMRIEYFGKIYLEIVEFVIYLILKRYIKLN